VSPSVAFDRAAEIYDQTRAISEPAMRRTLEQLVVELGGRGRVLEVGVGTGLLALPLHRIGLKVAGVDLSAPMLRKLLEKEGGVMPFPLARADATSLPFADGSFGGAYLRWVLHLVAGWRGVIAELVRVIRPGGAVAVNLGGFNHTWEIVDRFLEAAGGVEFAVGLDPRRSDELDREFDAHGARLRVLPAIPDTDATTVGEFLDEMEAGMHSWTWRVSDDVRRRVLPDVRAWAAERFGSLDRPVEPDFEFVWRVYDLA
jgi:SAM-dependent methyltransferase